MERIPPEADRQRPEWFETLDPLHTPIVEISDRVAARRAGRHRYVVEYGVGVEPGEGEFVPIHRSGWRTTPLDGALARWDIRSFVPFATRVPSDSNDFTITLLSVFDERGQRGEARRVVFLHRDFDLAPGFPRRGERRRCWRCDCHDGMDSLKNHVAHVVDLNQLVALAMRVESARTL
jgi:hypothetical protein